MTALYHYSSEAEIVRIGKGFFGCTLPKPEWTHGAHWAATFWLMRAHPQLDLTSEMPGFIRRYNESVGGVNSDTEGYHETITQASLQVARAFLEKQEDGAPLHEVCNKLFESPFGKSDWLFEYWSKPVLFSVKARREWVAPDIAPLNP